MKNRKVIAFLSCLVFSTSSFAADSYSFTSNILNIPLVKVNSNYYANVQITVGEVLSIGSKDPSAPAYDTYNATNNQLNIPEVLVGGTSYYNVIITVGNILGVGANCATAAECSASISNTEAVYYGPANYSKVIQATYTPSATAMVSTLTNRNRYLISDASTQSTNANYLQVGSVYSASTGYAVEAGKLPSNTTYNNYFQKLIQVVADSSGYYRLESHLHPNNAIDFHAADGNKLKFRNNFGKATDVYGYVTFSYDSTTKKWQAKKRYKYTYTTTNSDRGGTTHAVSYLEDTAFSATNFYINLSNGVFQLVPSADAATPLYAYNSAIDFGIPEFLNPQKVAFVTNDPAPFLSKNSVTATEGTSGNIYKQVNSTYRNQVANPGTDSATKTSADAILASIKSAVEASGEKLR
jgi:hypothetical protein